MDSYFSLLNLSFVENCHISIFTTFAKQSMINRLSNAINRNHSAAKISKVMSIVGKKRDPGILDPEPFLAQIRKVEARLGKLAKIRKVETD